MTNITHREISHINFCEAKKGLFIKDMLVR